MTEFVQGYLAGGLVGTLAGIMLCAALLGSRGNRTR